MPLNCFGEAPVVAEKALQVKGLEKTGRDFEPEYQSAVVNLLPSSEIMNGHIFASKLVRTSVQRAVQLCVQRIML